MADPSKPAADEDSSGETPPPVPATLPTPAPDVDPGGTEDGADSDDSPAVDGTRDDVLESVDAVLGDGADADGEDSESTEDIDNDEPPEPDDSPEPLRRRPTINLFNLGRSIIDFDEDDLLDALTRLNLEQVKKIYGVLGKKADLKKIYEGDKLKDKQKLLGLLIQFLGIQEDFDHDSAKARLEEIINKLDSGRIQDDPKAERLKNMYQKLQKEFTEVDGVFNDKTKFDDFVEKASDFTVSNTEFAKKAAKVAGVSALMAAAATYVAYRTVKAGVGLAWEGTKGAGRLGWEAGKATVYTTGDLALNVGKTVVNPVVTLGSTIGKRYSGFTKWGWNKPAKPEYRSLENKSLGGRIWARTLNGMIWSLDKTQRTLLATGGIAAATLVGPIEGLGRGMADIVGVKKDPEAGKIPPNPADIAEACKGTLSNEIVQEISHQANLCDAVGLAYTALEAQNIDADDFMQQKNLLAAIENQDIWKLGKGYMADGGLMGILGSLGKGSKNILWEAPKKAFAKKPLSPEEAKEEAENKKKGIFQRIMGSIFAGGIKYAEIKKIKAAFKKAKFGEAYDKAAKDNPDQTLRNFFRALWNIKDEEFEEIVDSLIDVLNLKGGFFDTVAHGAVLTRNLFHDEESKDKKKVEYPKFGDMVLNQLEEEKDIKAFLRGFNEVAFHKTFRVLFSSGLLTESLKKEDGRKAVKKAISSLLDVDADVELKAVDIATYSDAIVNKLKKIADKDSKLKPKFDIIKTRFDEVKAALEDNLKKLYSHEIKDIEPIYPKLGQQILGFKKVEETLGFLNKFDEDDLTQNFKYLSSPTKFTEAYAGGKLGRSKLFEEIRALFGFTGTNIKPGAAQIGTKVGKILAALNKLETTPTHPDYKDDNVTKKANLVKFIQDAANLLGDTELEEINKAA